MNLFALSGLLTGITSLSIGFFVYFKRRGNPLTRIWIIFSLSVAIWGFGCFKMASTANEMEAFLWYRLAHIGVILIPVFIYHFVFIFLDLKKRIVLKAVYFAGSIFFIANLVDLFRSYFFPDTAHYLIIAHMKWVFGSFYMDSPPGPMYPFFVVFFFMAVGIIYYELSKALKESAGTRKAQVKYFFIANLIGFVGGGTSFLPVFGINVYPIGNFATAIYPLIIAYAILAHQLMDIEVIIKKTLVFAGLFVASYAVLASFVYFGSTVFENVIQNRWIAIASSVFIIVLMLRPLENFLKNATDKYLFQKKYDYKQLLKTFTDEVITVLDLDRLVRLTADNLVDIMKLENATILLRDEEEEEFRIVAAAGLEDAEYELEDSEEIITRMKETGEYVLLEGAPHKKTVSGDIERNMSDLQAVLAVPLLHQNNMVGILSLGKKKSDEEFAQDDIDILLPLAKTLSIAITNARLFEKLSEAQAQAAQREKMAVIGTLSAGINHEICNPLGIVRGQCEMFLLNLEEGIYKDWSPEELLGKAKEIMEKVINETDRATVITKKLSSFAKPSPGIITDNVNVEKELDEVISLVEYDLKLDNITISKETENDLPPIAADRKQLQEIFFNVIRNAAQSIKHKGKITMRAYYSNKRIYIDIEDTGEGMSKNHLAQIFNPFFTTKDPGEGTGLGLFIVKQIVERNKGRIAVKSDPGKGTAFYLRFNAILDRESDKSEKKDSITTERN